MIRLGCIELITGEWQCHGVSTNTKTNLLLILASHVCSYSGAQTKTGEFYKKAAAVDTDLPKIILGTRQGAVPKTQRQSSQ